MQRQVVRLTRQELYEKMWSRPAISLAEEFGISGRGLGKICSRFEIPVPPRGYWAKLAAGKHVTRIPLPTAKSDVPSEILIQPSAEGPAAALPEQVRAEVTAILENRDQIQVPETLRSPHPIVKRWLGQKLERRKVDQLSGRRSEPPLDATERRKLRILSAIFSEIEKLGHAVKETSGEVYFEIGAQRLDYKVSEHYKQVQIQLSDEERRRSWNPAIATRTDLEATGELCFEITTYMSEPIRKRWRDGKRNDPKPEKRAMDKLSLKRQAWSSGRERGGHEGGEEGTFGRADPAGIAAGGGRHQGGRDLPRARDQRGDVLHLEEEVFGTGCERTA